jgi:hypothetical protein
MGKSSINMGPYQFVSPDFPDFKEADEFHRQN